jgi:hypothetical protein
MSRSARLRSFRYRRYAQKSRRQDVRLPAKRFRESGHRMSITTSADTLTAETSIDEVKKAIDAGGMS